MLKSNIGTLVEEAGLKDGYIAKKLNVTKRSVYNWRKGLSYPNFEKAFELASLLDCKVDDLAEILKEEK
ncbi:helix-turn-helix domain-containing protein [Sutcliffiella horikoshii]|uniref:Helix-turn-helix transcriptional regulator n=2 Tax=Sutcliffiella horikoshii TaxID=79883 RepID=A0A5D4TG95_9BACI|nr:helix-turn-helix transcriptional regulator [Sutcliffiella horikoshii]